MVDGDQVFAGGGHRHRDLLGPVSRHVVVEEDGIADTEPEPVGSYFSTNDFVPDGGSKVILGFGGFSDMGVDFRPLGPGSPFITNFQAVPRGTTQEPSDDGQFGVAAQPARQDDGG